MTLDATLTSASLAGAELEARILAAGDYRSALYKALDDLQPSEFECLYLLFVLLRQRALAPEAASASSSSKRLKSSSGRPLLADEWMALRRCSNSASNAARDTSPSRRIRSSTAVPTVAGTCATAIF